MQKRWIFAIICTLGLAGCSLDEVENHGVGCPGTYPILVKDGFLVIESDQKISSDENSGFYYVSPVYAFCDETGKSIVDKDGKFDDSNRVKGADKHSYPDWDEYVDWMREKSLAQRLGDEKSAINSGRQLKNELFQLKYIEIGKNEKCGRNDTNSKCSKYKTLFKYNNCPETINSCEFSFEMGYYCANVKKECIDDVDCEGTVDNADEVICHNDHCKVVSCVDGFRVNGKSCVASCSEDSYYDNETFGCKENNIENCGRAGYSCAENVEHWAEGRCEKGICKVSKCGDGYKVDGNGCTSDCKLGMHYDTVKNDCVSDDLNHCGSMTYNCENVSGWKKGNCEGGNCVATACTSGYLLKNNQCESGCKQGEHLTAEGVCEEDSVQNCGRHDMNCAILNPGWMDGTCSNGICVATSCSTSGGYHLNGTVCVADTHECCGSECMTCGKTEVCSGGVCSDGCSSPQTACGEGESASCANLDVDMGNCGECGNSCTSESVTGSTSVVCSGGSCIANACSISENYHLNGPTCEEDSVQNCGRHGNDCSLVVIGWGDGKCEKNECIATGCSTGYHLKDGKCEANSNDCCGYTEGETCRVCAGNEMCSGNTCSSSCSGSTEKCGSGSEAYCANTSSDMGDCGACGAVCDTSKVPNSTSVVCQSGVCIATGCNTTKAHLEGTECENDSVQNCGRHGYDCFETVSGWADGQCTNGTCVATRCKVGSHLVSGRCEPNTNECCGYVSGTTCRVCAANEMCSGDNCSSTCSGGESKCGSGSSAYCANIESDMNDCGGCGSKCTTSKVSNSTSVACQSGNCVATACDTTKAHLYSSGCETDSVQNCGRHGSDCSTTIVGWAGGVCLNGACVATSCEDKYHLVGGKCVANTNECCGYVSGTTCRVCAAKEMCTGNTCSSTCSSGQTMCGNGSYCANTASDVDNCGSCGNKCLASNISNSTAVACQNSSCIATNCKSGYILYNGSCVECRSSFDCSISNGTGTCSSSNCSYSCNAGYQLNGSSCERIGNCVSNSDCTISHGTGTCSSSTYNCSYSCNAGYQLNGTGCEMIGNCVSNSDCAVEHGRGTCSTGTYTCSVVCDSGYTYSAGICKKNECDVAADCPVSIDRTVMCKNHICIYTGIVPDCVCYAINHGTSRCVNGVCSYLCEDGYRYDSTVHDCILLVY